MEGWNTPEQQQQTEGISSRTFFRKVKRGDYETKYIPSPNGGGKGGKILLVRSKTDQLPQILLQEKNTSPEAVDTGSTAGRNSPPGENKDRYKIHRGEPGCNIITEFKDGEPILRTEDSGLRTESNQKPTGSDQGKGNGGLTTRATQTCDPRIEEQSEGRECAASTIPGPAHIAQAQDPTGTAPQAGGLIEQTDDAPGPEAQAPSAPVIPSPPGETGADVEQVEKRTEDSGLRTEIEKRTEDCGLRTEHNLPSIYNDKRPIPESCIRIGNLRYAILQKFQEDVKQNHRPKGEIVRHFLDLYKTGFILPEIRAELGEISRATLYNWIAAHRDHGREGLDPQYGGGGASKITDAEKLFLRKKLLQQNKPTIGDTINKCKYLLGDESPSSPSTLRRWVNQFRKENYDLWTLEREGEKALNDKCVPYAEREWRDLSVGDIVVADGHKLNFQVINPFTGKPTRATMVLFWDWKSAYPLGWEIMLTENIQCVSAALRNAVITLGKFPAHALLDNGKAFRASIFTKNFKFQDTEIPGIFDRLGIKPHFAMPYNAQAKPIERFFRTFNDWYEREDDHYVGSCIDDKPPRMNRNEKRAQSLCTGEVSTIPETMERIFNWREYYGDQEMRARDGARPRDIFEAEKGPGVDPFALHFLMMACKARMVHRNGITFNGWHWYHESLYGLKDHVLMYYSYYDLSQVYIFYNNEYLGAAKPVEKVNPLASDSEFPEDMAKVNQILSLKRKAIGLSKKMADTLRDSPNLQIDWNKRFRDNPAVAEAIQKIEDKSKPKVIDICKYAAGLDSEAPAAEEKPLQFKKAWERYEFHLQGGVFKGEELDQQFMDDYRSGIIAPGEWEETYGKKQVSAM